MHITESADAGRTQIHVEQNEKDRRMKDRAKHMHVRHQIMSNNEKRFYKLKAERAHRNSRTKGKTEGEYTKDRATSKHVRIVRSASASWKG